MKQKFWGYVPYNENTFENLWKNAKVVVDANILLNLYRYSKETQQQIINCLKKLSDRLWIPHNTMKEYLDNRINVICSQESLHQEIKTKVNLTSLKETIKGIRHLTLASKKDSILKILNECEKHINEIIDKDKENATDFINNDLVLSSLAELFDGKVGEQISDQCELEKLKKEIDNRYEGKIPPGFEDAKRKKDSRKYGDCINWFEIIKYSKENKVDVIYVTDDQKDDWILEVNGQKIGPRPELLNEFYKKTDGSTIYIYNTTGFLNNFNNYFSKEQKVSEKTIKEINDLEDINYNIPSSEVKNKYETFLKLYSISDEELSNIDYVQKLNGKKYFNNIEHIASNDWKIEEKYKALEKFAIELINEFEKYYLTKESKTRINRSGILSGLLKNSYTVTYMLQEFIGKEEYRNYSWELETLLKKVTVIRREIIEEINNLKEEPDL